MVFTILNGKVHIFWEIATVVLLRYVVPVKSTVEISQIFVAFSEYSMNFTTDQKELNVMTEHFSQSSFENFMCPKLQSYECLPD